jgi:hypothetical protein
MDNVPGYNIETFWVDGNYEPQNSADLYRIICIEQSAWRIASDACLKTKLSCHTEKFKGSIQVVSFKVSKNSFKYISVVRFLRFGRNDKLVNCLLLVCRPSSFL